MRVGANHWHPPLVSEQGGRKFKIQTHTMGTVLMEMVMQICMAYNSLPDYRTLDADDIVRFYEGIRESQLKYSQPGRNNG